MNEYERLMLMAMAQILEVLSKDLSISSDIARRTDNVIRLIDREVGYRN